MEQFPYSRLEKDLILRDYLAADRTLLANENTLLAYSRTALTFFVAGVSFIRFFDNPWLSVLGWAFVPLGVALLLIGAIRYQRMKSAMSRITCPRPE
jgi:putative membrane protein